MRQNSPSSGAVKAKFYSTLLILIYTKIRPHLATVCPSGPCIELPDLIITILVISTLNANLRVATRVYDVEGGAIFSKNGTFVFFDGAAWTPRLRSPSLIMAPVVNRIHIEICNRTENVYLRVLISRDPNSIQLKMKKEALVTHQSYCQLESFSQRSVYQYSNKLLSEKWKTN